MLLGGAASFVGLLAIVVAPEPLPLLDLPRVVDACVKSAARILSQPLEHWPSIFAALILFGLVLRLLAALVTTGRDARRARPKGAEISGGGVVAESFARTSRRVRILPLSEPVAYTTGLIRPAIVISTGLLEEMDPRSLRAVMAHESAHARRGHVMTLFGAKVLERAFGFIPGVRLSVRYLVMSLEAAADDAAVRVVGDRLIVAEVITAAARFGTRAPQAALGVGTDEVAYRVRRLAGAEPEHRSMSLLIAIVMLTAAALLAQGTAWAAGSGAMSRERTAFALHEACHRPHSPTQLV